MEPAIGQNPQKQTTNSSEKVINALFDKVRSVCPAWRLSLNTPELLKEAKIQWSKAFIESGITSTSQLNPGLKKARRMPDRFMPCPGEFIRWCQEGELISAEQAWLEACHHSHEVKQHPWSHERVRRAGELTGWHSIRTAAGHTVNDVKTTYLKHYQSLLQQPHHLTQQAIEDKTTPKTIIEQIEQCNTVAMSEQTKQDNCQHINNMAAIKDLLNVS